MMLEDMQDAIAAKTKPPRETVKAMYGGKMPSFADLARKESHTAQSRAPHDKIVRTPAEQAQAEANRRRAKAKTLATLARIMSHLDKPMTAQQLSPLVNLSAQAIGVHLRAALDRGLVTRSDYSRKKGTIWSKVEE